MLTVVCFRGPEGRGNLAEWFTEVMFDHCNDRLVTGV